MYSNCSMCKFLLVFTLYIICSLLYTSSISNPYVSVTPPLCPYTCINCALFSLHTCLFFSSLSNLSMCQYTPLYSICKLISGIIISYSYPLYLFLFTALLNTCFRLWYMNCSGNDVL